jgi:hypothetical protein
MQNRAVPAKWHRTNAVGKEVREAESSLERVLAELTAAGIPVEVELVYGEPVMDIVNWVKQQGCDLVAMSTYGHHCKADLVLGTTATHVQHCLSVPVLMLRVKEEEGEASFLKVTRMAFGHSTRLVFNLTQVLRNAIISGLKANFIGLALNELSAPVQTATVPAGQAPVGK